MFTCAGFLRQRAGSWLVELFRTGVGNSVEIATRVFVCKKERSSQSNVAKLCLMKFIAYPLTTPQAFVFVKNSGLNVLHPYRPRHYCNLCDMTGALLYALFLMREANIGVCYIASRD